MADRLAVYGTLAPGQINHRELAALGGIWFRGVVRGTLVHAGWGADLGFPGLMLDPDGPPVAVEVFESSDLSRHWTRLDAFEGIGYRRVQTRVETDRGTLDAWIYELKDAVGEIA